MEKPLKLSALLEEFASYLDVEQATRKRYSYQVVLFSRWLFCQNKPIDRSKRTDIIDYKQHLLSTGKTVSTVRNYLTSLKVFYSWLEACGYYENIAQHIKLPSHTSIIKRQILSAEECRHLLASIDQSTIIGVRDFVVISLLLRTALRRNELLMLNVSDFVSINNHKYAMVMRKGQHEKTPVHLTQDTWDLVHKYLEARSVYQEDEPLLISHSSSSVFRQRITGQSIWKIIKKRLKVIGLTGAYYTTHSLRHTAINLILDETKEDLQQAMVFAGHKSINTTQIYLKHRQLKIERENPMGNIMDRILKVDPVNVL